VTRRQLGPLLLLPIATGCSRPPAPPPPADPVKPAGNKAWRRDENWFSYTPAAQPDRVYFGRLLAHLRLPGKPAKFGSDRILWLRFDNGRWNVETATNYRGPLLPAPLAAALEPFLTEREEIYFWAFNVGDTPEFRQEAQKLEQDLLAGKFISADEEP
jgi:hypothetical protein